ncbi:primase-helicase family protein [Nitrobacter sp. JJSN]|uniref:primase-helicase family protein n=1 Tax=Nitrobacter sp. JJSN TaxID=3453033 RepID=UPI003F762EA5
MLDLPKTASVVGNSLIFCDGRYPLASCEIDADGTVEIEADYVEGDQPAYVRLRPETLRIFDDGQYGIETGVDRMFFDTDKNRQWILEDFPALKAEVERRAYLRAVERWEYHPAQRNDNQELPEFPVYEPARAQHDIWQAAIAEYRANGFRDFAKVEVAGTAYFDACPKTKMEIKLTKVKKTGGAAPKHSHEYQQAVATDMAANDTRDGVGFLDFWCYSPTRQFIFVPTGEMWSAATIDARLPRVPTGGKTKDGKDIKMAASTALTQMRAVDQATWMPGMPAIIKDKLISLGGWFDRDGSRVFNLYKPPTLDHVWGRDVSPWLNHVKRVYPNDWQHIVAWLAHRVQRPDEKPNHAIVLGGPQGIGKDTLLQPVAQAVGPWNCCEISPRVAVGRFNGFVKSVILRISEARDRGEAADQFEFYEATKTFIAAPPDVIRCDEKNLKEHMVPNVMGVVLTTNNRDGLWLPADDRRHFVCWSSLTKEDFTADYWNRLWGWFEGDGYGIVAEYLANYDLSDFNPKAPPPKTDAFWAMVDIGRPSEDAEMADAIAKLKDPDAVTLSLLMPKVSSGFGEWLRDRRNARKIRHRFEACDYVAIRNPDDKRDGLWVVHDKRQAVYAKKELPRREQIAAAQRLPKGSSTVPMPPPPG